MICALLPRQLTDMACNSYFPRSQPGNSHSYAEPASHLLAAASAITCVALYFDVHSSAVLTILNSLFFRFSLCLFFPSSYQHAVVWLYINGG